MATTPVDSDDEEIVRSVRSGNRDDFRKLVYRYQPAVAAIGRRILSSPEEVADYVQEVFLRAFDRLGQFTGRGRFYSWLTRIAYHTAVNRAQRRAIEVPTDPDILEQIKVAPQRDNPEKKVLLNFLVDTVSQAIHELPRSYSRVVELFIMENFRYDEIAVLLDMPINTIKSYVHRGRMFLRRKLQGTSAVNLFDLAP